MIWFAPTYRSLLDPHALPRQRDAHGCMLRALQIVAEVAPQLQGNELVQALAETGWVDAETARRLLPTFRDFDADRHFGEHLRRLSFRGVGAEEPFRHGVGRAFADLLGSVEEDRLGEEPALRVRDGERESLVLAYPEVGFTFGPRTRAALRAAVERFPDAVVVVARNFQPSAAEQLRAELDHAELPGTLVTVNLLLGMRAMTLRYQPGSRRVTELLARGGALRSRDIATLGDRLPAAA
jgi:hypothetical protein